MDVDEQRDAARRFNVSSYPSSAVIKNGQRVRGSIGMLDADELLTFLSEGLKQAEARAP